MKRANPEVKLALAVERRLRRPAPHLRALLAAVEREVLDETPLAGLLTGSLPLSALAALLEAPAPRAAGERTARGARPLSPAGPAPDARHKLRGIGGGGGRDAAAARPLDEIGRPRPATDRPDAPGAETRRTSGARLTQESAARLSADGLEIAQRRSALRRTLATLPRAAGALGASRLPAAGGGQQGTGHAPNDSRQAEEALPPHALSVATALVGGADLRAGQGAARAVSRLIETIEEPEAENGGSSPAMPRAEGVEDPLGRSVPNPSARSVPNPSSRSMLDVASGTEPPIPRDAAGGIAPPPIAAGMPPLWTTPPRRSGPPFASASLHDDEALAEIAWRNGVGAP